MIYEIQNMGDFSMGRSLVIKIPECELDKKALYTISADRPDFILPFRCRSIDGQIELVYQVGSLSPLDYPLRSYSPKECVQLWTKILNPLLDCGDWFLKPYSFVLNSRRLYFDEAKNVFCYVYIPSVRDCSDHNALKEMAVEIAGSITVDDDALENKILRMIMKGFNPKDFLHMLKPYGMVYTPLIAQNPSAVQRADPEAADTGRYPADIQDPDSALSEIQESAPDAPDDIIINIPASGESAKSAEESKKSKGTAAKKKDKKPKKAKSKESFFSRLKSAAQEEVIIG